MKLPIIQDMQINNCPICNQIPIVEAELKGGEYNNLAGIMSLKSDYCIKYNIECKKCGLTMKNIDDWNKLVKVESC